MSLKIPADWKSGYYTGRLTAKLHGRQDRPLGTVLRRPLGPAGQGREDPAPTRDQHLQRLLQLGRLQPVRLQRPEQACRAAASRSTGPSAGQFRSWELPSCQWAEKAGYATRLRVNSDLEFRPELLKHYKLVLSVGHDEYWSAPMRDNLEKFIAGGGNVAFFSGNTCCWQVRSEDNGRCAGVLEAGVRDDPLFAKGEPPHC